MVYIAQQDFCASLTLPAMSMREVIAYPVNSERRRTWY